MSQESEHNKAKHLSFRVSHDVVKLLARAAITSGITEAEESASKLTHLAVARLSFLLHVLAHRLAEYPCDMEAAGLSDGEPEMPKTEASFDTYP